MKVPIAFATALPAGALRGAFGGVVAAIAAVGGFGGVTASSGR
jgi:hypothetical protein